MTRGSTSRARLVAVATAFLAVTFVGLAVPSSAEAISIRRIWHAPIGASNGAVRLVSYTTGIGSMRVTADRLRPTTTYAVIVYAGSCSAPRVVTRLPAMRTDAAGSIRRTFGVSAIRMNTIWSVERSGSFGIKFGSRAAARCGRFTFAVASRIAIASLGIDLPVVDPPNGYPLCDVAMYIRELSQPREAGVTLIYAHARAGMFLPLLERSRVNNGRSMLGMTVKVWTNDAVLSTYRIERVRRHVTTLDGVFDISAEQLWIQTSEGPRGTREKLMLVARRIESVPASIAASHPSAHPLACA
ncbi:MAG TPA: hypothetical protein VIV06_11620 [Candidatus Limnocylindrales bacterium]